MYNDKYQRPKAVKLIIPPSNNDLPDDQQDRAIKKPIF